MGCREASIGNDREFGGSTPGQEYGKFRGMMRRVLLGLFATAVVVMACQVPVFRFALERWPADQFALVVTSEGELAGAIGEALEALEEELKGDSQAINLTVQRVNLATLTDAELVSLPALEHAGEGPTLILMPPASWKSRTPVWTGEATVENLSGLLDSPLRQRCGSHLLNGASAVWVLVESGDPAKDAAAREVMEAGVKEAEATLEIPEGVIRREDFNKEFENIDPDNILRSGIPLKIDFVTEVVSADDPEEVLFLSMLMRSGNRTPGEPLLVPLFGRGRTFGGLTASQMTPERIVAASEYLCGACSCQVKEGNPGYDLLFRRNWDRLLEVEEITADSAIIQRNLHRVVFDPEGPGEAGSVEEVRDHKPLLIGLVVFNLVAFGALSYLRRRHRLREPS